MNRKQFTIALAVLAVAGFLGGAIFGRTPPAVAQAMLEDIVAQRVMIVDSRDRPRAFFGMDVTKPIPMLALLNENGKPSIAMTIDPNGEPFIKIYRKDGTYKKITAD